MKADHRQLPSSRGTLAHHTLSAALIASVVLAPATAWAQRRSSPNYEEQQAAEQASRMQAERQAAAKAAAPWHDETSPYYRFNRGGKGGILTEEQHFRSASQWTAISRKMANKRGMFADYTLYVGVQADGRHAGIIYVDNITAIMGASAASEKLMAIDTLSIFAEGGEAVEIPLGTVETAQIPSPANPQATPTVFFRQFTLPPKAYRMMAALPDKNRMQLLYSTRDKANGAFGYHFKIEPFSPWLYSIGYAKELSLLATEGKSLPLP